MATRGPTLELCTWFLALLASAACQSASTARLAEGEARAGAEGPAPRPLPAHATPAARADAQASLPSCPEFGPFRVQGIVEAPELNEVSGLAASRQHDVLWTHNDSGDRPRLYGLDFTGRLIATVKLHPAEAVDWEDIALAPNEGRADSIYVADFGDNRRQRRSVVIYVLDEPADLQAELQVEPRARLELRYPDGPHNAESLLVHPTSHELFIVTKDALGVSRVYRKKPPHESARVVVEQLGELHFGVSPLSGIPLTTAGDYSADGRLLAIRTYNDIFLWSAPLGADFMKVVATSPCARISVDQPQGESLAFARDGSGLWTLSEHAAQPLLFLPMQR